MHNVLKHNLQAHSLGLNSTKNNLLNDSRKSFNETDISLIIDIIT